MNRRNFLGSLTAIAGTLTLDPERLLWRPGEKKIFIPAPPRVLRMSELTDRCNLVIGDILKISHRYAVNPMTREFEQPLRIIERDYVVGMNGGHLVLTPLGYMGVHDEP